MADDDEVDILGDFNSENFLSKTDTNMYVFRGYVLLIFFLHKPL